MVHHLENNIKACENKIVSYQKKIEEIENNNHGRRAILAKLNNNNEKNKIIIRESVEEALFKAEQQTQDYHRKILHLNNQIAEFQEEIQGYRNYEEQRKNATNIKTIRVGVFNLRIQQITDQKIIVESNGLQTTINVDCFNKNHKHALLYGIQNLTGFTQITDETYDQLISLYNCQQMQV